MDNNQQKDNRPSGGGNGNQNGPNKNRSTFTIFLVISLITLLVMAMFNNLRNSTTAVETTYDEFLNRLDRGMVESVVITSTKIEFKQNAIGEVVDKLQGHGSLSYYTGNPNDPDLVKRLVAAGVAFKREIPDTTSFCRFCLSGFCLRLSCAGWAVEAAASWVSERARPRCMFRKKQV